MRIRKTSLDFFETETQTCFSVLLDTVLKIDEKAENFPSIELSGRTLANAGIPVHRDWGDFQAQQIFIEEIKKI